MLAIQLGIWICATPIRRQLITQVPNCIKISNVKKLYEMRPFSPIYLWPEVLLYRNPYYNNKKIIKAVKESLAKSPDLVTVASTRLEVLRARFITKRFCYIA